MVSRFHRGSGIRRRQGNLYHQLTQTSSVGLFLLGLAISFFTTQYINQRLERLALHLLTEVTQQLVNQGRFAFFESEDLASTHLRELAQFPGVIKITLFRPDARLWLASPGQDDWRLPALKSEWNSQITLVEETDWAWYFVAPAQVKSDPNPLEPDQASRLLGYMTVAWRKALFLELQKGLFWFNVLISLLLAVSTLLIFQVLWRRLTQPLDQLLVTIHKLRQGETGTRALVAGPVETREIALVFNALLDNLERNQRELESLVTVRTQDLRAARDAALTAMRYKSEFMAAVTHEMRLPLQSILGYTQDSQEALIFLAEHTQSGILKDIDQYLNIVRRAADDLLARINQVLDLAAFEAGKRDLHLEPVHLPQLLEEVLHVLKPLIEKNHNQLNLQFTGLPIQEIDSDKIKQIVRNLLDNASKFTHEGRLSLEMISTDKELSIIMVDSGIGIAHHHLAVIFEPFRQADMSNTRRFGGTGLGLAITRNLCTQLGGQLSVQSEVGLGSTFTVVIPLPISPVP